MKLWWDLLSPDGYGYSWGRSLGTISYMDTMEIADFVGKHPEFRPAPLSDLASAYFAAWSWLQRDFSDRTHLLSIFALGRGDYGCITKEREWQQTTTFFGKVISAHQMFMSALEKEGVKNFATPPNLPTWRASNTSETEPAANLESGLFGNRASILHCHS